MCENIMNHKIIDNLIYKNDLTLHTVYDFYVKEWNFRSRGKETFVFHKRQLKIMNIRDIGDGMRIPFLKNKSLLKKYDNTMVKFWMSSYQWFDEKNGETKYYAYWAKSDTIKWVNLVSEQLELWVELKEWKFVEIQWWEHDSSFITHVIASQKLDDISSFLFGIALIYGNWSRIENSLSHVSVQLPLVDSLASLEDHLLKMIDIFFDNKLFMTYDYQDMKAGQLMQIHIDDHEILDVWSGRLWGEEYDLGEYKSKIDEYVWQSNFTKDKVLKFLHK